MPTPDPREYLYFYLLGRRDDELPCSIDLARLANRVLDGEPLRAVTLEVAEQAANAAELDGYREEWVEVNEAEVKEAGGDADKAYGLYRQGQIDELAVSLESEVLEQVQNMLDTDEFAERANERRSVDDDTLDEDEP